MLKKDGSDGDATAPARGHGAPAHGVQCTVISMESVPGDDTSVSTRSQVPRRRLRPAHRAQGYAPTQVLLLASLEDAAGMVSVSEALAEQSNGRLAVDSFD